MALALQKFAGYKLKIVALGPIAYGPPQQDPAQLRAEIASNIFPLGVSSSGGLTAALCFLPFLSPALFHKLLTCQPLSSHCKHLSVSASLHHPCTILAHVGPTSQAARPSFSSLLQRGFHCLCVAGQQTQCHCHSPIFLTVPFFTLPCTSRFTGLL